MRKLDWLSDVNKRRQEDKHKDYAYSFQSKCQVNECNNGREILQNDYPYVYNKMRMEMAEDRFNDDILYNSEIVSIRKDMVKNKNYLDDLKEQQ